MSEIAPFDPERIVTTLARHDVDYVLIGALAARLQGFPRVTTDADITPSRAPENLERLAAALRELDARVFTETVPGGLAFDCTAEMLARSDIWNLVTVAGRIDMAFSPAGIRDYEELTTDAVLFSVFGVELQAASLAAIIRSKEAADRPQDRQDVILLRSMLNRSGDKEP